MNLIGSIFRKLGIGNSSDSVHQSVRDSREVIQAGRDVNVHHHSEPEKSYPKIGEAYFPEYNLSLDVHDFVAGQDRQDRRYQASIATPQVARFVVTIREKDYTAFELRDNQGPVALPCAVKIPEGDYDGEVTYVETVTRESDYMGLLCWFCENPRR